MGPHVIALTGSIGAGKSTTAAMFAALGVPVWDADAAVHRLYAPGGAGAAAVAALCPEAVGPGGVDRAILGAWALAEPGRMARLEAAIHPLVAEDRARFIAGAGAPIVLIDVPLLFETGGEARAGTVVVVSAPEDVRRARVLARPGMTAARYEAISARQVPDAEKRARADFVVETVTMEGAKARVAEILDAVRARVGQGRG